MAGSRLCGDTENAVARAFAIAYLLTADAERAEAAVCDAADCWNPEIDSEEALILFSAVTTARLLRREGVSTGVEQPAVALVARELAPIAGFDAPSRGCFVLRLMIGLPLPVCAQMLGISAADAQERLYVILSEMPHRVEREQENW